MIPSDQISAFTIDVEDYFHVSAYNSVVDRRDWDSLPARVEHNTQRLMEILAEHETFGTFFVLGWVAERYPGLIKEIVANGHEVACHGMSHKLIYAQGREAFKAEARASKTLLEDICGVAVNGYRAASFSITRSSLWALDDLAELGFEYDSSIFPVRHDRYGIPGAPRTPFKIEMGNGNSIAEFPMTTINVLGWHMPVSGGGYFRIYPYSVTKAALRSRLKAGEPLVFYTHPWEIDPEQPMFDAGWVSNLRHRANLSRCESRLHRLLSEFQFSTMSKVLDSLSLESAVVADGEIKMRAAV